MRRKRTEVHNQKQEPHTLMLRKIMYDGDVIGTVKQPWLDLVLTTSVLGHNCIDGKITGKLIIMIETLFDQQLIGNMICKPWASGCQRLRKSQVYQMVGKMMVPSDVSIGTSCSSLAACPKVPSRFDLSCFQVFLVRKLQAFIGN